MNFLLKKKLFVLLLTSALRWSWESFSPLSLFAKYCHFSQWRPKIKIPLNATVENGVREKVPIRHGSVQPLFVAPPIKKKGTPKSSQSQSSQKKGLGDFWADFCGGSLFSSCTPYLLRMKSKTKCSSGTPMCSLSTLCRTSPAWMALI